VFTGVTLLTVVAAAAWAVQSGKAYRGTLAPRDGLFGFYTAVTPSELHLADKPSKPVKGLPKNAGRVRYGTIRLGSAADSTLAVALVGTGGEQPKLYVDANRDWNMANEKPVQCRSGRAYRAEFTAPAKYKDRKPIPTRVVLLIPSNPGMGPAIYATDTHRAGSIKLAGGKRAAVLLVDADQNADFKNPAGTGLLIDPTGQGDFAGNPSLAEPYDARQPFNVGGVTYEVAYIDSAGTQIALKISNKNAQARPILVKGYSAPGFTATDTNGKRVSLSDYRGKVTLLDFWATWCGPCILEMPNVKRAYDAFHGKGFDILGVSLDRDTTSAPKYARENGMSWKHISDGKWWKADIAVLYKIQAIPASFLLDKEGRIIARDLRGDDLFRAVEKALKEGKK